MRTHISVSELKAGTPKELADSIEFVCKAMRDHERPPWHYGECRLPDIPSYPTRTLARLLVNNLDTILDALDPERADTIKAAIRAPTMADLVAD
jgi:hypothetical protein